jgi:hypothetical protein
MTTLIALPTLGMIPGVFVLRCGHQRLAEVSRAEWVTHLLCMQSCGLQPVADALVWTS